ncbi:hypothetical protein JCM11641_005376 [Rhodosporidiobolus odoratus]
MVSHNRTHSTASSTGSLSDDLALFSSSSRPPTLADPFNTTYAYGTGTGDASLSDIGDSPFIGDGSDGGATSRRSSIGVVRARDGTNGAADTAAGGGGGRSRARAFSFLSVHQPYGMKEGEGSSPATGETPFMGGGYDFALEAGDDSPSEGGGPPIEMRSVGAAPAGRGGRGYRHRFQPLVGQELAWMGVSAACVLGLTVGAVVLTLQHPGGPYRHLIESIVSSASSVLSLQQTPIIQSDAANCDRVDL